MLELNTKVAGYFKIEAQKLGEERRVIADWFPNLILNNGLNLIGNNDYNWLKYCQVGSGSGAPNITDTTLDNFVASTNSYDSISNSMETEQDADSAYAVTITPGATSGRAIVFTLGTGNWANGDINKTIENISGGETGIAIIRSISGNEATCDISENFTDTNAIASGDWELYTLEYFVDYTKVYEFSIGAAAGNLQEIGVGPDASGNLFSRALIVDAEGDPISLTILNSELLYVTYNIRRYIPNVDTTGQITLRGITHDYLGRAAYATTNYWAMPWGAERPGIGSVRCKVRDGIIGLITSYPGGSLDDTETESYSVYANGDYYLDVTFDFSVSEGNLNNFISVCECNMHGGMWQFSFDPDIEKTNNDTLSLTFRVSWGRK